MCTVSHTGRILESGDTLISRLCPRGTIAALWQTIRDQIALRSRFVSEMVAFRYR